MSKETIPVNQIICGDCLEVMKDWPDGCVDKVFCSPPYEDARTYSIDFTIKGQDWVDWAMPRFIECLRVCKGLVAWVVEGKTKKFRYSASPVLLMADLHRAGVHLRKPPAFHRVGIPGSGGPDWLRNDYEFIVCATNGGKLPWSDNKAMGHLPKWAPGGDMSYRLTNGTRKNQWGGSSKSTGGERQQDGTLRQAKPRPSHKIITKRIANGNRVNEQYAPPTKANPGNTIQQFYTTDEVVAMLEEAGNVSHHNVGKGHMGHDLAHENEAPFPESLADFFIRSFCPPDGIVLDPFSGSGTTAAAAHKAGRRWITIDVRQSQIDLGNKRIKDIQIQGVLFDGAGV